MNTRTLEMKSKTKKELGTFFLFLVLFCIATSYLRSEFFPASRTVKFILVIPHMWGPGIAAVVYLIAGVLILKRLSQAK